MATLIWSKVRDIRIGDTHVPFEIKYDDGSSLIEDSSSTGYKLAQAVNGAGGMELCLNNIGWCLNRGQPNYDWASFWNIADSTTSYIYYDGSGDVGYLFDTNNKGLYTVGYGYDLPTGSYFSSDEHFPLQGSTHAPLQPYWNIENESVYVDIPVPTKSPSTWLSQDDDGVWSMAVYQNTSGLYNSLHSALGDLGTYHESATWHDDTLNNGSVRVPLEEITNEVLYGLKLTLVQNQASVIYTIHGASYATNSYTSYVPMKIMQAAPDFDFSVDITSINNLPAYVLEDGTSEGTFSITSNQFNGSVNVHILNSLADVENVNSSLSTNFAEDDAVNYGHILTEHSSYSISEGETIEVSLTYTADSVFVNQTDSYTIIIVPSSINASAYGEFSLEAQEQFENSSASDLMRFSDVPTINIMDSELPIIDEYSPSNSLINKPSDIIFHILEQELGYNKEVDVESIQQSRAEHNSWRLGFSVNKEIDSKKLIKEISQSSKLIPTLSNDVLRFIDIKSTYRGGTEYYSDNSGIVEDVSIIKSTDIIKYKFSRTKMKDVVTKIQLDYDYDYGTGKYKKTKTISVNELSYWLTSDWKSYELDNGILLSPNHYTNYYSFKTHGNEGDFNRILDHSLSTKKIKNKYLSDNYPEAIDQFLEYNLMWGMNQHNIITMTLPLKYYNLEVGDLIEFDKMISGNRVYGEKYVLDDYGDIPIRCGQFILPLFVITETNKSLNNLSIKVIQLHHMSASSLQYRERVYGELTSSDISAGVIRGDVDNDSTLSLLDVIIVINAVLSGTVNDFTPEQFLAADYNQDGFVDINDIIQMVNDIID
tara:strand:- start:1582 stop:4044 length:2463 start_codon:yes stop_codon:yes gene_type:complete